MCTYVYLHGMCLSNVLFPDSLHIMPGATVQLTEKEMMVNWLFLHLFISWGFRAPRKQGHFAPPKMAIPRGSATKIYSNYKKRKKVSCQTTFSHYSAHQYVKSSTKRRGHSRTERLAFRRTAGRLLRLGVNVEVETQVLSHLQSGGAVGLVDTTGRPQHRQQRHQSRQRTGDGRHLWQNGRRHRARGQPKLLRWCWLWQCVCTAVAGLISGWGRGSDFHVEPHQQHQGTNVRTEILPSPSGTLPMKHHIT